MHGEPGFLSDPPAPLGTLSPWGLCGTLSRVTLEKHTLYMGRLTIALTMPSGPFRTEMEMVESSAAVPPGTGMCMAGMTFQCDGHPSFQRLIQVSLHPAADQAIITLAS